MKKPVIGLMLGDVTGIGPEISARLLASGTASEIANVVVIGDKRVLDLGVKNAGVKLGASLHDNLAGYAQILSLQGSAGKPSLLGNDKSGQ